MTVNCNAAITTAGEAYAVNAASTGGTGGSGGSNNGKEGTSDNGTGGNGGGSGLVSVNVAPGVTLTGGISAASIAGAGGTGSDGKSYGGGGGNGGGSGGVQVNCQGDISSNLCGIWAQSISGAGGNGGNVTGSGESYAGDGGNGGAGGSTTVTCSGSIGIIGNNILGILAQSWGGAAGAGGTGRHAGSGGYSGAGGTVTVNLSGSIKTVGLSSYGILAQSLGGAGGSSGETKGVITYSGNATNGADGGEVTINTGSFAGGANSSIATLGANSTAICGQSVGGGDGTGDSTSGIIFSLGGSGGSGGQGGTVTVNNGSQVTTQGFGAHGIQAQSVGGNGGNAGGSVTVGAGVTLAMGGSGGDGGNGGEVNVGSMSSSGVITYCTSAISTTGLDSKGIFAQSVGGGGGGVSSYDQSQLFSDANNNGGTSDTGIMPYQIQIGGKGGAGGDGGTVQVTNSGGIYTSGDLASGIYAQSIGGGGGSASVLGGRYHNTNYKQYFTFAVDIGQSGGSGGNGGAVTVTNTANITTLGDNANGIFAQSVGAAGGSGSEASSIIQGFLWNGSVWNGASGAGGAVNVSQTGTIPTSGTDAHGIVAQSTAGKDKAGNVTVTLNDPNYPTATPGNIFANGLGSSGLVAQSLGKNGSGTIDITINQPSANTGIVQGGHSGTVTNFDGTTTTYNAYGVLIMDGQNNTLTNHGAITTMDATNGTAVMVQASYGAPSWGDLTISNYGTITGSVNQGAAESTPMTNGSNMTLPTGQSTITFNNYAGSTYNAGPVINLGGGLLTNSGVLSLGTGQSALTGNYTQTGTGTFQTTVNADGSIGQLNVSGTAHLAGTLQMLKGTGPFHDGTSSAFLT